MEPFKSRLVPPSISALLWILSGLLIFGAIVPVGFLTARDDWSKTLLLIAFGAFSTGVLVIVVVEVQRIRAAADLNTATF
jgi:hypothetical protein